ncbi:hypothetical protein NC652_001096 [Populus alba x Populus x berolinensis]|nr:hypothetical protein NC652_001096 [Populus alba x Populus x berolinensis]
MLLDHPRDQGRRWPPTHPPRRAWALPPNNWRCERTVFTTIPPYGIRIGSETPCC